MNKQLFKQTIIFAAGLALGAWVIASFFPTIYQGKSAYQWNTDFNSAQNKLDTLTKSNQGWQTVYDGLTSCLQSNRRYTDYYNGASYYVNDVTDVTQCISDSRQQLQDQSNQQFEEQQQQKIDQNDPNNVLGN